MNNTAAEFAASLYRNASKLSGPEWSAYLASEANAHRFNSREFGEVLYLVSRSGCSLISGKGGWRVERR